MGVPVTESVDVLMRIPNFSRLVAVFRFNLKHRQTDRQTGVCIQ